MPVKSRLKGLSSFHKSITRLNFKLYDNRKKSQLKTEKYFAEISFLMHD